MIHIGLIKLAFQFVGCSHCHYLAVHHNGDAVAILSLVHIMSGDEDRNATVGSVVYELPELATRGRIHSSRRFVEEYNSSFGFRIQAV